MTLLEALIHLRDNGPADTDVGICSNVSRLMEVSGLTPDLYEFEAIFTKWPKFSGNITFPISGRAVYSVEQLYGGLWEGEQLSLRKELIDFAIKELSE